MIMSSGRFSSGKGGGSNREVVFTARVETKDARQQLTALAKDVDNLQKQMSGMRVGVTGIGGTAGGMATSGRPGVSRPGGITFTDSAFDRQQENYWRRMSDMERRAPALAKKMQMTKGMFNEATEGLVGLTRAFVLFGATTEESLEKALRAMMKFEAGVAGVRGLSKISGPLGTALSAGGSRLGLSAGAGTTGVGMAGMAALVGVAGAGAAIYDQVNYARTGKIGAYSSWYSDWVSKRYRNLYNMGGTSEAELSGSRYSLTTPQANLAASGIRYERQLMDSAAGMYGRMPGENAALNEARLRLAAMERQSALQQQADSRRTSAVMGYASLSPWDQRGAMRLRDKYFRSPNKLSSRQLMAVMPFLGEEENERISGILTHRNEGFLQRGFTREDATDAASRTLRIDQTKLQRELVLKLVSDNQATIDAVQTIVERAYDIGNEDLKQRLEAMEKATNDAIRAQNNANVQRANSQASAMGTGF